MSTLQGESFYFHHGWHFLRADTFPMAKAIDAHRDAEGHAFYEAGYRETGWQPVTLPHTFNDEDLFRDRIQDGGSGQRRTAAFYRNILTIPARHKNHKVLLAFEGLRQTCYLYVNGTLAGYYEAGVAPFGFDITPYVRYDAPNLIAIATDNTATRNAPFCIAETPNKPDAVPGSYLFPQEQAVPADRVGVPFFWNCNDFNPSVGGITRPVQVFFKPDVYLTLPLYSNLQTKGLYVYGRNFDLDNATADIRVEAEVRNEGKVPVSAQLRITLRRPDGSVAAIFDGAPATAAPTGRAVPPLSITPADAYIPDEAVPGHYRPVEDESLPAPTATDSMAVTVLHAGADTLPLRFWSIDDPYLYTVEAELFVNGEKTDALCAVPLQVVQVIPDRMVAVFIGNNLDGALHLFLAGKPVVFFQIQKQVVHVHVGQSGTGALPAQRLHNVNLLRQKVQAQRPTKQRVTLEHRQAVSDAVLHAAFLRPL